MSQQVVENSLYDCLIKEFEQTYQKNQGSEPEVLLQKREAGLAAFQCTGIPTIKNEEWRFTNLAPFLKDNYQMQPSGVLSGEVIEKAIAKARVKGVDAYKLVLVNGAIELDYSELPEQLEGWCVQSVAEAKGTADFAAGLNRELPIEKFPFAAINTACFSDGFYIALGKDVQLDKPLQIIHIYGDSENLFLQPRNMIKISRGASAEILESSVCVTGQILFINGVTEIQVEENAHFKHAHFS